MVFLQRRNLIEASRKPFAPHDPDLARALNAQVLAIYSAKKFPCGCVAELRLEEFEQGQR